MPNSTDALVIFSIQNPRYENIVSKNTVSLKKLHTQTHNYWLTLEKMDDQEKLKIEQFIV